MEIVTQDEELKLLEIKLNQLKLDYEKYFIGTRPTEPGQLRSEIQKTIIKWSNTRITNSALRFKFNSLNGRYQAFKRQWDSVLRQIEAGTYKRHIFRANLHDRERGVIDEAPDLAALGRAVPPIAAAGAPAAAPRAAANDLFDAYRAAMKSAGQDTSSLSRAKLEAAIAKQEAAVKKQLGCAKVAFTVVVQDGKVKLKAAAG